MDVNSGRQAILLTNIVFNFHGKQSKAQRSVAHFQSVYTLRGYILIWDTQDVAKKNSKPHGIMLKSFLLIISVSQNYS